MNGITTMDAIQLIAERNTTEPLTQNPDVDLMDPNIQEIIRLSYEIGRMDGMDEVVSEYARAEQAERIKEWRDRMPHVPYEAIVAAGRCVIC